MSRTGLSQLSWATSSPGHKGSLCGIRDSVFLAIGFHLWRKFRDSQDGPGKRKEPSIWRFCIFLGFYLFIFFLSEFSLSFHVLYHRRDQCFFFSSYWEGFNRCCSLLCRRRCPWSREMLLPRCKSCMLCLFMEVEQLKNII